MPPSASSNARSLARAADETGKADWKLDEIPPSLSAAVSFLASAGDRTLHSAKP